MKKLVVLALVALFFVSGPAFAEQKRKDSRCNTGKEPGGRGER